MTTMSLPTPRSDLDAGRPRMWSLLAGQLGYALRDLWRTRIVFIFTLLFPLTWLIVIGFLVDNLTVDGGTEVRFMQFVVPTAVVMGVLYGTYPTVANSLVDAREQGVLRRFRGTPLPAWIYLAGRIGAAVMFALASLVTMLVVGVIAYDVQIVWRTAFATLVTVTCAIAAFAAAGLAVAGLVRSVPLAQAVSIGSAVIISFLSGVGTVGDMPSWADRVAAVFPVKPFYEALQAQFNPFGNGAGWDVGALAVIAGWAVGSALVAGRVFRWDPASTPEGRNWSRSPRRLRRERGSNDGYPGSVTGDRGGPSNPADAARSPGGLGHPVGDARRRVGVLCGGDAGRALCPHRGRVPFGRPLP